MSIWELLTYATIALGLLGLVVLEVVRMIRGTGRYLARTGDLWFGPTRRFLAERRAREEQE